jgi:hypothetical protein
VIADGTARAVFTVNPAPPNGTLYGIKAFADNEFVSLLADKTMMPNSATVSGADQIFEIGPNADGTLYVKSQGSGAYCQAISAAAAVACDAVAVSSAGAKWTRVDNGDGTISLKNSGTAGHLVAENGGTLPLKANRANIAGWEKFTLIAQ